MKIKVGDKVAAVNESVEGRVVSISNSILTIESEDGFLIEYFEKELITINDVADFKMKITEGIQSAIKEKESNAKKQKPKLIVNKKNIPAMEVDLHIEKLVSNTRGLDNYDILNIQMETARRQLDFAIRKRFQRVIFIHGVGEGVLKSELESLFRRYEYIKHYEADLQKYGRGATEVYIPQNQK